MEAVARFKEAGVDLLVSLVGSFTWDNMPVRVAQELNVPIILWGVPEPPMEGGRLEANSLVGVTMNAAALKRLGFQYKFVYGFPDDPAVVEEIARTARVMAAIKRMRHTRLGIVGGRPPGFYGSTYDELRLRKSLGVEVIPIEVSEVFAAYDRVSEAQEMELPGGSAEWGGAKAQTIPTCARRRFYTAMQSFLDERMGLQSNAGRARTAC
jgi:L-fucose isomerase-like protein